MNLPDDPRPPDVASAVSDVSTDADALLPDSDPTADLAFLIGGEPAEIVIMEVPEQPRSMMSVVFTAALVSSLISAALTAGLLYAFGAFDQDQDVIQTAPPAATDVVALVATRAIPSIVTVHQFGEQTELGPLGSGSGVVFRSDGHILTNEHVVAGADSLKVVLADGSTYSADLVGADPLMDIAVLRIDVDGLVPIPIGDLSDLGIGSLAIAVGNPLGLDGGPSVTSGVISAFDRTLTANGLGDTRDLYGLLQTDAPITRGSSGGALLNRNGELIGITTAIGVSDVGAEGLGFAVPVHLVVPIADDLIANGSVQHAFLGIEGQSAFIVREDGSEFPLGAEIRRLLGGSAIGDAGAQPGDVIVALEGESVNSMILLVARLRGYRAGDEVTVTLERDGLNVDVTLVLDRHPSS